MTTNNRLKHGGTGPGDFAFAYKLGTHVLYKFKGFRTPEQRDQVRDIVLGHRIYFARASQLNDPEDLRPLVKIRRLATERETRDVLIADIERHAALERPTPSVEEIERRREAFRHVPLDILEKDWPAIARARIEREYPVFCASSRGDLVGMWNEYADGGTGVCIHLRSDRSSPFGLAQRMNYEPERPIVLVPVTNNHELAQKCLLTKGRDWRGEFEFRFVRYPDVPFHKLGLKISGQFGTFSPDLIAGISVGPNMDDDHLREVIDIARSHVPPLNFLHRPMGPIVSQRFEESH